MDGLLFNTRTYLVGKKENTQNNISVLNIVIYLSKSENYFPVRSCLSIMRSVEGGGGDTPNAHFRSQGGRGV